MKRARRMLAWALVAALGLTNVDYVRAEGISGNDYRSETAAPEVSGADEADAYSAGTGTSDAPDEDGIVLYSASESGSESGVTWEIADGVLTISGEKTEGTLSPSWKNYKDDFTKVVITAKNINSTANWFESCTKITEVDMSAFDTSNVTSMGGMFEGCSGLTSLDVSGFDTSNVEYMSRMFYGCSRLTSLDVSGFDTGKVITMRYMFYNCSSLTSLDVSGFDTGNVRDMSYMFSSCRGLTSLDVSGFETGNVSNMSYMFYSCRNLTSLDVGGFATDRATNMSDMFGDCKGLTSLDVSGFKTDNVTNMNGMFYNCSSLTSLDVSGFVTGKVTNMSAMFEDCKGLTSLDVSGFKTDNVTNMNGMFYNCSSLTSLDVSGFATGKVTDMRNMFSSCSGLTSLDVSSFETGNVTNMNHMFNGCSGLTSLDVSGFATGNVTDMRSMFSSCSGLTSLDVSGFATGNVTDMSYMFSGCSGLTSLDVSGFETGNVSNMSRMFIGCSGLTGLDMDRLDTGNVTDMSYMFNGCSSLAGLDMSGLDTGNVITMSYMFYGCSSLTSLDMSGLDIGNVTDMSYTFNGCSSLAGLDMSGLDTGNVITMSYMFYGCSSLTSLDISGLDIGNVTDMRYMFNGCSGLTGLDISGLDTGNVTDMSYMFNVCSGLTSLDMRGLDTGKVTNMRCMFYDCSGLTSLDMGRLDTGNVTDMSYMFSGCSGLTSLDVSGLGTGNVTNMQGMFNGCSGLTDLDMSGLDTGNVTTVRKMFADCSNLTSLDLSKLDTRSVRDMQEMFYCCDHLESLDVSGFDTGNALNMDSMFLGCSSLTSLDVSGFNTGNVTDMSYMFADCGSLMSLDVSGFDTGKVRDMSGMFAGCSSLTSLDVSGFDTGKIQSMFEMFAECYSIVKMKTFSNLEKDVSLPVRMCDEQNNIYEEFPLNLPEGIELYADESRTVLNSGSESGVTWEISENGVLTISGEKLADTYNIFPQWQERKNFFTKVVITAKNIDSTSFWFYDCGGITEIDLSGFDTGNITDMSCMFADCSGLTSLDVSSFDTGNITDMSGMFAGCSGLTSLDVSGFDTGNVTDMSYMFADCGSLTSLDVSGFDTRNVRYMDSMFAGCGSIVTLKTFPNLAQDVDLPVRMCDEQDNVYEKFPLNLPEGIYLYADDSRTVLNSGSESGVTWEIVDGVLTISGAKLADTPKLSVHQQWQERKNCFTKVVITAGNIDSTVGWFEGCGNITEMDLSGFDTGKVTDTSRMFYGCSGITMIKTFPNLQQKIALPVKMQDAERTVFESFPIGLAESIILYRYEDGNEFGVEWEITDDGTLVISGTKIEGAPSPDGEVWKALKEKFTKVVVTAGNIDSTAGWFEDCGNITEIDLSGFDTGKVTDMSRMFSGCSGLTSLDLSGFDTKAATDMSDMFTGCVGITTLKTFPNLQKEVALPVKMRDESGKTYESFPTGLAESIVLHGYDYGSESGLEWEITDDGVLLISGAKTEGTPNPDGASWRSLQGKFTKVVITAAGIESTAGWFEGCANITEIDMSGFDTGKVTDMSRMFSGCNGLTSLDVSGFDTRAVTDMHGMFSGCSSLMNLDVSGFDTKAVTDMSDIFAGCSGMTKIKVFPNLQLGEVALPLPEMYDEKGDTYRYCPTGLAEGIELYAEKPSNPPEVDPPVIDPPVVEQKGLRVELVKPGETYYYTGSAIKPAIAVYNGDRLLTEGTDYTVKYSNNVKAVTSATTLKKMPTVSVIGKGRFTGRTSTTFAIKQRSLSDVKIGGLAGDSDDTIIVASGSKASPVLIYNGMKLSGKDYTIDKANEKFTADTADKTLVISAKSNGNYMGELHLKVQVVEKSELKKISSVTIGKETITYDGNAHTPASITVKAGKEDITGVEGAYAIVYHGDKTSAGTQKVTIIGLGIYTGSVTGSYTIQPRKTTLNVTNALEKDGSVVCVYHSAGVTFDDKLTVEDSELNKVLEQGRDYKVTYSGNKKTGVEKAKYTVTFLGNYKGSAAVKNTFTIEKAPLSNTTVTVSAVNKVYNKKGVYKSSVYVVDKGTGVALKSSDYKVEYFLDEAMRDKPMNRQNPVELGADEAYRIVYVKVTGKGNYAETTYASGLFKVYRKRENQTDISKSKVTFQYADGKKQSKVEYTGEAVYPERIEIKISRTDTKILKPDENGSWDSDENFSVEFLNNIEKGKATAVIRAKDGSNYVGSKTASFGVVARNLGKLDDFWKGVFGLLQA